MTDSTIIPSPMFDLPRVAEAIRRQVRLDLDPVYAKAAVHGMPVELTEDQSRRVAAVALAALVAAHPIDGKQWLIDANKEWVQRADQAQQRCRAGAHENRALRWSRANWQYWLAWSWVYFLWQNRARAQWHWPVWTAFLMIPVCLGISFGIRRWTRRQIRRVGSR